MEMKTKKKIVEEGEKGRIEKMDVEMINEGKLVIRIWRTSYTCALMSYKSK